MALQFPSSPRPDVISPPVRFNPVPELFPAGETPEKEEWFFNMKVHNNNTSGDTTPRKPKQLDPVKHSKGVRGHSRKSRDQSRATKPVSERSRKLASLSTPSPAELREQIEIQTARSIGDSLIFHNIPERLDDTPEAEVVKFCQDYLVGRRIKHVQFGHVHKMEQRFSKNAPIAARFSLILPPQTDAPETEKYQPLPYVPRGAIPKRKLPMLKTKTRRNTQSHVN